jgi:hypothetical protein
MTYLGRFAPGAAVFYAAVFHSDQGTVENPTAPTARLRTPGGTWSALATPAIQDNATGLYGGTIDTAGFPPGQYIIHLRGTVSAAKTIACVFVFEIATAAPPPTPAEIADQLLARNLAGGADGGRTVRDALRLLRNRAAIVGDTLTVYREDDATPAWTAALTTNANAAPVVEVDPA